MNNSKTVIAQLKACEPNVRKATRRALNKVGAQALTLTVRELSNATGVTQRKMRAYVKLNRADYGELRASVHINSHTFNIASVAGATQTKRGVVTSRFNYTKSGKAHSIVTRGKGGVTAVAWGRRHLYPSTFLIQGGKTAMVRVGKARLPIRPVWGPRITQEYKRNDVDDQLKTLVSRQFAPTMKHELEFALGRFGLSVA